MKRITITICALGALAACGDEPLPRSTADFMEDPILLEATMVRCVEDRTAARHDPECLNAREAVDRIAAAEQQARRDALEAQSEQKRQALRRAQQAAAEARQLAVEAERRRREAEYFGEFEPLPRDADAEGTDNEHGDPPSEGSPETAPGGQSSVGTLGESAADDAAGAGNNRAAAEAASGGAADVDAVSDPAAGTDLAGSEDSDIEAVREELERRHQNQGD